MIKIEAHSVFIENLTVSIPEVRDFLARQAEVLGGGSALEDCVRRCLHLGALALEKADAAGSVDFIRKEVDAALARVKQELAGQIGTGEGQVLHPIQRKVDEIRQLLSQDLDPNRPESALARIRAILDPNHTSSIQNRLNEAVASLADRNKPLSENLRRMIKEALEPIQISLAALSKNQSLREESTLKGVAFEEEVDAMLGKWAHYTRNQVERVSGENDTGDFVVVMHDPSIPNRQLKVAIEVKDHASGLGRKRLQDCIRKVLGVQAADAAIWVCKTHAGFAQEIGEWAEGRTDEGRRWTACTVEHLLSALRYTWILWRLDEDREERSGLDAAFLRDRVRSIRDVIKRFNEVNTAGNAIKGQADTVLNSAGEIKKQVTTILEQIESELHSAGSQDPTEAEAA